MKAGPPVSALTEDEDFLFTDWEMVVEEVLKDNPQAPITVGSEILVTRLGGEIVLNGRSIRAIERAFRPFRPEGRYLLFLHFIPSTGSYQAFNDESFELTGSAVHSLRPGFSYLNLKRNSDPELFKAEVRAAVQARP